jgi:hypothetical protein
MAKKVRRIVLDTNIWIHFLISNDYSFLDKGLKDDSVKLLFSSELLEEFLEVVSRPKFSDYFSHKDIIDILSTIEIHAEFIKVKSRLTICRDDKDNFLLSLAKDSSADYLITGDKDLLELEQINQTQIITIAKYKKLE